MSILDLVSGFLAQNSGNTASAQQNPMAQVLTSLLNDPGTQQQHQQGVAASQAVAGQQGGVGLGGMAAGVAGVVALVNMFKSSGFGDQVQSWLSTGANLPVQGADVTKALGQERVAQIAQTLGVNSEVASQQLAQHIPALIDKISPNGELPQNMDQLKSLAQQFLGTSKSA